MTKKERIDYVRSGLLAYEKLNEGISSTHLAEKHGSLSSWAVQRDRRKSTSTRPSTHERAHLQAIAAND
jgi:hypothetical protein